MVIINSNPIEDEFTEAKNNWELEKLYLDLASAKGKGLTPVEKKFLRGLLCGYSPAEIAKVVYQTRSSSTVRVYLSNGLYKYIEEMLSIEAGYSIKVKNWSRVTNLLEKSGYKKNLLTAQPANIHQEQKTDVIKTESTLIQDWGEAIDVSAFHGRIAELITVQEWIVQQQCRLVVVLGMGGIGKTAFAVKLAEEIQDKFEYMIWRSLRLSPPIEIILNQFRQIISPGIEIKNTETVDNQISQLIDGLRLSRCLIVLDHVDSILCNDQEETAQILPLIRYRQGYENYAELIRRIGESQHQSCILLTSREKLPKIAAIEGEKLPVRTLKLNGVSQVESNLILQAKGLINFKEEEGIILTQSYAGNPLFIKLVATTIQELFGGSIYEFIKQGTVVFGEIRAILEQQFNRLSKLEKQIMYWMALNPDFISVQKLQTAIMPEWSKRLSQRLILEAIDLLQKRSLIEKTPSSILIERQGYNFTQTPIIKEYVIERLIEENLQSNEEKESHLLMSHKRFEAELKNYIQSNQELGVETR